MKGLTGEEIIHLGARYLMKTYSRAPLALVRGEGAQVWEAGGRRYLDFLSGISVNNLGHCHPRVVAAIEKQSRQLLHCSNLYWSQPQVELARKLVALSGLHRVFFCNSGAEANEAAIKLARRYGYDRGMDQPEILAFYNSFHGRTLGTLAATGQEQFSRGFTPLPGGFKHIPYNDLPALYEAVGERTVAILVEPVQGEGGVHVASPEFMQALEQLRRERGVLLIFDEVQCGLGRTGRMFAWEHYGVRPDILVMAKALGGGLPLGAIVAREEVAAAFQPGSHGSTFGGNPVACAAALTFFQVIEEEGILERVRETGSYFIDRLFELKSEHSAIRDVRGLGLLLGMELDRPGKELVEICLQRGLLVNCTAGKVIRFLPPLIAGRDEVDECLNILTGALKEFLHLK